jgi:hypothetical protein
MRQPTRETTELTEQLVKRPVKSPDNGHVVHVSELTSLPAFAYEKLRNIVDYKDEYLLRKNAIKRYLKRVFVLPKTPGNSKATAQALVRELILSRYLPNDTLSEEVYGDLAAVLDRYEALLLALKNMKMSLPRWREALAGIAAVECDAVLISPALRHAYMAYAVQAIKPALEMDERLESPDEIQVQLVTSIQRVLERADKDILMYYMLLHYYHAWFSMPPVEGARLLAPQFETVIRTFLKLMEHPLGKKLLPICRKLLVPVIILRGTLERLPGNVRDILTNPDRLTHEAGETYRQLWRATRSKIRRKGFHAMVYILITKVTLAFILELPYERYVLGSLQLVPLAINLLFPPLLMAIITVLVKAPSLQNEQRILAGVQELVYGSEVDFFKPRRLSTRSRKLWAKLAYGLLYVITIGVSFGVVLTGLWRLGFNPLSGALFIFFISLVSFFGIGLRQQARQLKVVEGRETLSGFIIDFFSYPIVALGKWLSTTFDKINVFVMALDFLFEVPFKSLLKVLDDWFQFLKEKKEEIY